MKERTVSTLPGPIQALEIDVETGRVQIRPGLANEAKVDRTRRYLLGAPEAQETVVDGMLRVQAACESRTLGCSVDYVVEVPAAVAVRVRTDSGPVEVVDMGGMVEVETGAGGIRLTGTEGPVRAFTSTGNIDGDDLVAGFLDASTDAGRIRVSLAEPSARVALRTEAGDLDLALPAAGGGYRITTETDAGEGDLALAYEPGANRAVTATTGAGDIRIRTR